MWFLINPKESKIGGDEDDEWTFTDGRGAAYEGRFKPNPFLRSIEIDECLRSMRRGKDKDPEEE